MKDQLRSQNHLLGAGQQMRGQMRIDHLRIIQVRENFNHSLGDNLKRPHKSTFGWCYTADFFTVYALVVELTLVKISAF